MAAVPDSFPLQDPVGPAGEPLPAEVRDLIATRVAEDAAETDRSGVPRETIDALAAAGLLGTALSPPAMRELGELLSGADATTWFCWVQHQTPLRTLEGDVPGLRHAASDELVADVLPGLRSGQLLGAVAFAHVRRPGPANPSATRVPGGWRLDGTLDWVTSWDIADVVLVMAQGAPPDDDLLVCAYLPAGRAAEAVAGLVVQPPLDLLAMSGTHTRPLRLESVVVPDARIGAILDRSAWLAADARRTADANPSAFGLTRGAVTDLRGVGRARGDAGILELSDLLVEQCRHIRARAYGLADADGDVAERLRVRAESLDLAVRAATAVVTARSGAAMRTGTAAERRVREAMFLLVQAQTASSREASLRLQARRAIGESDIA